MITHLTEEEEKDERKRERELREISTKQHTQNNNPLRKSGLGDDLIDSGEALRSFDGFN